MRFSTSQTSEQPFRWDKNRRYCHNSFSKGNSEVFFDFNVFTLNIVHPRTFVWGCVSAWFGRALAWHASGQRFDPAILRQKSTVLRRKYGAFLFAEADFWGAALLRLHRFQAFAGGSYTTPNF